MVCLLLNIKIFCENNKIEPTLMHKMWNLPDFEYPNSNKPIIVMDEELPNNAKQNKKTIMNSQQNLVRQILKQDIIMHKENNLEEDAENDKDVDLQQVAGKRKKVVKCTPCSVVIQPI